MQISQDCFVLRKHGNSISRLERGLLDFSPRKAKAIAEALEMSVTSGHEDPAPISHQRVHAEFGEKVRPFQTKYGLKRRRVRLKDSS
ncbi:hypothetical protein DWV00_03575 [Trinickia dinghuensis]|uniref:Uncharacterized protein n=1 Tax=Trinickia dinghuensis TaxID=2291023 RepID=A0A3D8K6Z1_9BURK|nr:hypothetical protein DWV00_03575 [Trinickia dinghuensis]